MDEIERKQIIPCRQKKSQTMHLFIQDILEESFRNVN